MNVIETQLGILKPELNLTKIPDASRKKLCASIKKIEDLKARLADLPDAKQIFKQARRDFADGKLGLVEATALLMQENVDDAPKQVRWALAGSLKEAMRRAATECREILCEIFEDRVSQLAGLAASVEEREKEDSAILGIPDEDFQPSDRLKRIRQTHEHHRIRLEQYRDPERQISPVEVETVMAGCVDE